MTVALRKVLVVAVCVLGLASLGTDCGTAHFRVEIGGDLNSQVIFRVREGQGRRFTVTELVVVDTHDPDQFTDDEIVWHLLGESKVDTITYGEAPDGLDTKVGPLPLRREGRYSVAARGEGFYLMRLRAHGTCDFTVQADGVVSGGLGCRLVAASREERVDPSRSPL